MHIDGSQGCKCQHCFGQNPAIGHHHQKIRLELGKLCQKISALYGIRLKHGNAMGQSLKFDWRRLQLFAPAARPIRLADHGHHFIWPSQ